MSRDLEELGAVKVRIPGGAMAYAIPEYSKERLSGGDDHLRRLMGEFVVEVSHSLNLVVLRTPPGSAHVVASAVDRAGVNGVLGTVAGDDTMLLVCAENGERRRRSRARFAELARPLAADEETNGGRGEASRVGVLGWSRHLGRGAVAA